MADNAYHFRGALNGFHKGDVNGYIEKLAAQHRSELLEYEKTITTLREGNRSLQQQLNILMISASLPSTTAPAPTQEPVAASETQPVPASEQEAVSAPAPAESDDLKSMELQAYRRAEAIKRKANNRAKKLYVQIENLCKDALDEFRTTDSIVKQTIDAILAQANALEQSYQALSATLSASREQLAALNEQFTGSNGMLQDE